MNNVKLCGAVLIIFSSTCCSFSLTIHRLQEVRLLTVLEYMIDDILCELPFSMAPLPDLVRKTASKTPTALRRIFAAFADNLDQQFFPDVSSCMENALHESNSSFLKVNQILLLLGQSLGRFDLPGQEKSLKSVWEQCHHNLRILREDQTESIRCTRVLGICAGAALVILLI